MTNYQGGVVLDLGCGSASSRSKRKLGKAFKERKIDKDLHYSIAMANAFPNCTVHAVDCDQVFAIIIITLIISIISIMGMSMMMIRLIGFNREG